MEYRNTMQPVRLISCLLLIGLMAGCAGRSSAPPPAVTQVCPPAQPCPACPTCPPPPLAAPEPALPDAPALALAAWSDLPGWADDDHARAWPALRESCRPLRRQARWENVCTLSDALGDNPDASTVRHFFEREFEPWQATNPDGNTHGLVTGYYEPLIQGSRFRSERNAWPIHGVPEDMLTIDLGEVYPDLRNMRLRGRIIENRIVPYWTRAQLDEMSDLIPAPTLLWASDPIDLFFLQVQGSGQVELPDGSRVRIGYADQNGHPYNSIGRWLVAQGELRLDQASMQGIKTWAKENPHRLTEMLNTNPSYVFFRELPPSSGGPIGAQGVPLTAERSIAIDPRYVPLGAPVFLATTYPLSERPLQRLMLAQDTGGAIKGVVRADFFWGFGDAAGAQAGRMRQQGQIWVLLPKGSPP